VDRLRTTRARKAEAIQAVDQTMKADLEVAQAQAAGAAAALEAAMIQNQTPLAEAGPTATSRAKRRRKRQEQGQEEGQQGQVACYRQR